MNACALLAALSLTGCSVLADFDDFESPTGACEPEEELCDGDDNDCDGTIDEGFDTTVDPANCGACGRICVAPENTNPACESGVCGIGCPTGFADCDGDGSLCEADLRDPQSCGSCDRSCSPGDLCDDGMCVAGCGGDRFACDGRCVAPGVAPECGRCDGTCTFTCASVPPGCGTPLWVAASNRSFCALDDQTALVCWGRNDTSQLPLPAGDRATPTITAVEGMEMLAGGGSHFCGLQSGGRLVCWGVNSHGQLGNGTMGGATEVPQRVALDNVSYVAGGYRHTCAALAEEVWCWGSDDDGQVTGRGGPAVTSPAAVPLPGTGSILALAAGGDSVETGHSCAVRADAGDGVPAAICWGRDAYGQASALTLAGGAEGTNVIPGTEGLRTIAAGGRHTCGATDSTVLCWGANNAGQQGLGSVGGGNEVRAVTRVANGDATWDVVELTAGASHTCARLADGTIHCWGSNRYGEMGNGMSGTGLFQPTPLQLGVASALDVALSAGTTCVLTASSELFCFGRNDVGQVGIGETSAVEVDPVRVDPAVPP